MPNIAEQFVSGVRALAIGLGTTLKYVFRKPVTYQYGYAPRWSKPEERPIAPRYRGQFELLREPETGELRCTACGICAASCPGKCITVSGENKKVTAYSIDLDRCLFCALCVEACPFEALGMKQHGVKPQTTHAALHVELDWLAQPAGEQMPGVLPSTAGGDLRPGKKPFVSKAQKAAAEGSAAPESAG